MKHFTLQSDYKPTGDQPQAIESLSQSILSGEKYQTLLGVTGSGKTFTVANVIAKINKPTLVLAHNKTLAAQLYSEFKTFFPENSVEYFVSYYDYYQPEAYIPTTGTYIEKDLSINQEIEQMRIKTSCSLLSERRDIIVVASVSCIYGMGNPTEFKKNNITIQKGQRIEKNHFLQKLVAALYSRTENDFKNGTFMVKGDVVTIYPPYGANSFRVHFFDNEIECIESFDPQNHQVLENFEELTLHPANLFVSAPDILQKAIREIQDDLLIQVNHFKNEGKYLEAKRLRERTEFDLEMIKELGYCSGIENYSRYLDGRAAGTRPFCLLDYFPKDYLMVIDESHVTIPQTKAMYGGDKSRKENLVSYGFRLPAAMDNRPLKFEEFQEIQNQVLYVSATPADYEMEKTRGFFTEQIIRPTGLLDPLIEVRKSNYQIDDLTEEIQKRVAKKERVLVTTLTKRMAEELSKFLSKIQIKCCYIHSDVDTLERVEILQNLRKGAFDVLIGVNLLREGLDLPEVSLVAILDADKEGFLRSHRSLTQTVGRAARNVAGKAIFYADTITQSMQKTIDETQRRRTLQINYNQKNKITPKPLNKKIQDSITGEEASPETQEKSLENLPPKTLKKKIRTLEKMMETASKGLDFMAAAKYRDEINLLKKHLEKLKLF